MKKKTLMIIWVMLCYAPLFAQTAANFTITATDGQVYQLQEDFLDQGKTVLLKIFFTTCPPCNSIAPATEVLYQEWGGGDYDVEFIELSMMGNDSNADVADYKNRHSLTYIGAGADGGALTALLPYTDGTYGSFFGTPTFVVIAPNGNVSYNVRGSGNSGTINALDAAITATGAVKPVIIPNYEISGQLLTEAMNPISGVTINVHNSINTQTTSNDGAFSFPEVPGDISVDLDFDYPTNPLTGISTYDLVLISKHILGIESLPTPYRIIAADVNQSGSVTAFDMLEIRKLILFLNSEFPNSSSWRFIPACINFSGNNPFNMLNSTCSPSGFLSEDFPNTDYIGVRVGDASFSGIRSNEQAEDRFDFQRSLSIPAKSLKSEQSYRLPVRAANLDDMLALQFSLQWDPANLTFDRLEFVENSPLRDLSSDHFNITQAKQGKISASWFQLEALQYNPNDVLFYLHMTAQTDQSLEELLQLNSVLTEAVAFDETGKRAALSLQFPALASEDQLAISPNPGSGQFAVQLDLIEAQEIQLIVYDMAGKIIQKNPSRFLPKGQSNIALELTGAPEGLFILQALGNQQASTKRFVINR